MESTDQTFLINLRREVTVGRRCTLADRRIQLHIELCCPTSGPFGYSFAVSFCSNMPRHTCASQVKLMLLHVVDDVCLDVDDANLHALVRLICSYCDASLARIPSRRCSARCLHVFASITFLPTAMTGPLGGSPASAEAIEGVEKVIFRGENQVEATDATAAISSCAICLENFKPAAELGVMPCGHRFHCGCLSRWLGQSHLCPLCRFPLRRDA